LPPDHGTLPIDTDGMRCCLQRAMQPGHLLERNGVAKGDTWIAGYDTRGQRFAARANGDGGGRERTKGQSSD
jgi:hypothetical protein